MAFAMGRPASDHAEARAGLLDRPSGGAHAIALGVVHAPAFRARPRPANCIRLGGTTDSSPPVHWRVVRRSMEVPAGRLNHQPMRDLNPLAETIDPCPHLPRIELSGLFSIDPPIQIAARHRLCRPRLRKRCRWPKIATEIAQRFLLTCIYRGEAARRTVL